MRTHIFAMGPSAPGPSGTAGNDPGDPAMRVEDLRMTGGDGTGFRAVLKRTRTQARLTQEELAAAAGLSVRAISDLERGVNLRPRKDTARLLADALGLTAEPRARFLDEAGGRVPVEDVEVVAGAGATRTLPRDLGSFTGREAELATFLQSLTDRRRVIAVHAIGGMAGVGKTTFAVHLAHRLAPEFPDGQIFLALNGHTPGQRPVDPSDALFSVLVTAGHPASQIPAGLDARARVWRDHLAGRKILLLLDDAVDSEQIDPLLPGTGDSLVIVTSRRHLVALEDAQAISLDTLSADEAARLFVRLAGRPDLTTSDPAVVSIVDLCGLLPLAIGMLARQLRHHPTWTPEDIAGHVASARRRLEVLVTENLSVAAAFDMSYEYLSVEDQRLFRRLSLQPGTTVDGFVAAALDGVDIATARRGLGRLYDHHLLVESARDGYRFHDLIREHARALAERDAPEERRAATDRLLDYYLGSAQEVGRFLARRPLDADAVSVASYADLRPHVETREAAMAWMNAARTDLNAAADWAATHDRSWHAIGLAAAMHGFLRAQGFWDDASRLHRTAAGLAHELSDTRAEAGALVDLGDMQYMIGDYAAAKATFLRAISLSEQSADHRTQATALRLLAYAQYETAENAAAVDTLTRASARFDQLGDQVEVAGTLGSLAVVQNATGDYVAAMANQRRALQMQRELGDQEGEAKSLHFLGSLQQSIGDYDGAAISQAACQALSRTLGNRFGEANGLNGLGSAQQALGDYDAASRTQQEALKIYQELGHRMGQANVLHCLGSLLQVRGRYEPAGASLAQALTLFEGLGIRQGEAEVLNSMGELARVSGRPDEAITHHRQALTLAEQMNLPTEQARAMEGTGLVLLALGDRRAGISHLEQAETIFRRVDPVRADRILAVMAGPE